MKEDYLAALLSHTKPAKQQQSDKDSTVFARFNKIPPESVESEDELLEVEFEIFPTEEFEELILQKVRSCNRSINAPRLSALTDWIVFDLFPEKYSQYDLSFITDQFGKSLTDMLHRGDLVFIEYTLFPSAETKANPHIGYITE